MWRWWNYHFLGCVQWKERRQCCKSCNMGNWTSVTKKPSAWLLCDIRMCSERVQGIPITGKIQNSFDKAMGDSRWAPEVSLNLDISRIFLQTMPFAEIMGKITLLLLKTTETMLYTHSDPGNVTNNEISQNSDWVAKIRIAPQSPEENTQC